MRIKKTVYTKSFEEAVAANEADRWRESNKLNETCCEAIYKAIVDSNYEPNHYDLKTAAKNMIDTFGEKRVHWVLAATVQRSHHDGRYSRRNQEWAEGFNIPFHNNRHPIVLSHPCLVDGFIDRARDVSAELKQARAEKHNAKAEGITVFTADERGLFYTSESNPERDEKLGYIGRLRGDFGRNGTEFWTTWMDGHADLKTKDFSKAFDSVVNELRTGVLKDYKAMAAYCKTHPQALLSQDRQHYGLKLKTDSHVYCLNCCAVRGDYNFYVHVFERGRLEKQMPEHKPSLLGKLEENKRKAAGQSKPEPKKAKDLEV